MSTPYLILVLILSLLIMLVMVIKFQMNAALALLFASIIMGIGSGIPLQELVAGLGDGFGDFMNSTGLPIGLGIILGQILYDYGGANAIATSMINGFPKNKVFYAMALASFIVSIPVFFDVTFILLAPLGIAVAREIKAPMYKVCIALLIGAVLAHTCVPPAAGPLAAAGIMNVDVGMMIGVGVVMAVITLLITVNLTARLFVGRFWDPETDETGEVKIESTVAPLIPKDKKAPGALISMIPILVPVVALLIHTVFKSVLGEMPEIVGFLGSKTISMLMGVVAAIMIAKTRLDWGALSRSCNTALDSVGVVLMITGVGSAFGRILSLSGVTDAITQGISGMNASITVVIIIAYLIAMVLRVAQGSATVACVTAVSIITETVAALGYNPLFVCLAACAGAISIGHVNDSGFWIVASRCGFTVKGGLKCITLVELIMSLILLAQCVIYGTIFAR